MRRTPPLMLFAAILLLGGFANVPARQSAPAPAPAPATVRAPASLRFAVMGDTGTGDKYQLAVAQQMEAEYARSPFEFVLMLGDNNYRGSFPSQVKAIFETPYAKLLDHGVRFYATLGNHDQSSAAEQTSYKPFNMGGSRTYSFAPAGDLVELFTFDSTLLVARNDTEQLKWLDDALARSKARWKIVFMHHPPFSPGKRHGDNPILEQALCPILERRGVRVVMTGHEHFFAKLKPVRGVDYIISGSGGKIQNGGILPDSRTEAGNDAVHQFLSVSLTPDTFDFTVIGETGQTIYHGTIPYAREAAPAETKAATP